MERKDSIESTEKIVILEGPLTTNEHSDAEFESVVWRKVDICVVVTVFYLLSWLDRTNLGNARIAGLQTDLRLTNNQYSISLTMTLIPFLCSGLPVNLLMKIVGPNILLPTLLTLWGIVTTLQGTVHTFGGLLACRFFLGFFEGGMIPAITLYMSLFYPRAKLQQRLSIVYSAASLAGAFSGLLAAAILHMDGIGGKPGWAWIFILEGLFTVFFGLLSFFVIPRSAKHCTLLNAREREYVMDRLREDGALSQHESADHFAWGEIVQALKFPHVWFILVLFFFNGILIYSLGYFTPSIVQGLGWSGTMLGHHTRAQLMTVPPYAVGFVVTNVGSYIADHYKLRGAVRIVCSICLTAGFAMFLASHSTSVQYGSLFLAIPGANAVSPAITSWVANNTAPHVRRASAIAFACVLTNIGGILATWLFGSLSPPPRYTSATVVLLVASVGLGIAAAGNVVYLWDQNRRKDRLRAMISKDEEPEGLGDRSAWFTYIL
ncbi:MFS transporter superfamily protein [Pleurotus pulmonarius]